MGYSARALKRGGGGGEFRGFVVVGGVGGGGYVPVRFVCSCVWHWEWCITAEEAVAEAVQATAAIATRTA